jgi:hypothetical protein
MTSRKAILFLLVASLISPAAIAQAIEPDRIHWVEVDWFNDRDAAESLQAQLLSAGYSPVCVYPRGGIPQHLVERSSSETNSSGLGKAPAVEHSVRVGEFDIFMDALLLQEDLARLFPDGRVPRVRWNSLDAEEEAGRHWDFQTLQIPDRPCEIFELSRVPLISEDPDSLHFDHSSAAILEGGMITPDRAPPNAEEFEAQSLALFRMTESNEDPVRGFVLLGLGDLRASQGDLQGAREVLVPVACGEVVASPEERYTAMWLLARVYHAMGWRTTAYRAYREIETVVTDPRDQARCLVEQAGLLMELARSDLGRLFDCRLLASQVLQEFEASEDPIRQRCATAALMGAETWLWERDYPRCVVESLAVAETYADVRREWAVAMMTAGYALKELDRYDEALSTLMEVVNVSDWDPDRDDFPNFNMQSIAAGEAIEVLDEVGDHTAADNLRHHVIQRWPDSRQARDAQRTLDRREQ